jgi:hypothetical protein
VTTTKWKTQRKSNIQQPNLFSLLLTFFIQKNMSASNNNSKNNNSSNLPNNSDNAVNVAAVARSPIPRASNTMFGAPTFTDVHIDVVGVDSEINGRSCSLHPCCGHSLYIGDKLVCSWGVASAPKRWQLKTSLKKTNDEEIEEYVKVFKVGTDGLASCHVGFLPRRLFRNYPAPSFDLMFLRIKEDYRISENQHERSRSGRFLGIVLCEVIRNNTKYNGHNPFDNDPCDVSLDNTTNQVSRYSGKRLSARKSVIPASPSNMYVAIEAMGVANTTPRNGKQKRSAASPSLANTSPDEAPKKKK